MDLSFELLSNKNYEEALLLAQRSFPDNRESIKKAYQRFLDPQKKYLDERRLLEYFVVKDLETNKIVAVTGLYNRKEYPENEVWLGWFCVDPDMRGGGIGRKVLVWTIKRAKELGFEKMKLYTSTDPNESIAQNLYESLGLKIYKKEQSKDFEDEEVLYRSLDL